MTQNEGTLWDQKIDERNKTYLTSVLHFFYYRKNKLSKSWEKEETLTWELMRALEIIPDKYFLAKFLSYTRNEIDFSSDCILVLEGGLESIEIHDYPRLGLTGRRKKAASDIEFSNENGCLWIEAKTTPTSENKLMEQIEDQRDALEKKYDDKYTSIIGLVPKSQSINEPHLTWNDMVSILDEGYQELDESSIDTAVARGYLKIMDELRGRIEVLFE